MAHNKLVSEFKFDSEFPRDVIVCTLNFNHTGATEDLDQLCSDLANIWATHWFTSISTLPCRVRSYDNQGTPPVYPNGEATLNWTSAAASSINIREVALCLSYFSERNIPRRRGRVYLPCNAENLEGIRPDAALRQKALNMAGHFAGLGGLDVDWEVWSPTTNSGMQVSDAWVDDEWDIQRRRGLRPSTRLTSQPGP